MRNILLYLRAGLRADDGRLCGHTWFLFFPSANKYGRILYAANVFSPAIIFAPGIYFYAVP
jgi:hypothetical protein